MTPLSLSLTPAVTIPLGPNADLFSPGAGGSILAEYDLPYGSGLAALAGFGYSFDPYGVAGSGSLSILSGELGGSWRFPLVGQLSGRLFARGGMAWGFENGSNEGQGIASGVAFGQVSGGLGLDWRISAPLALRIDAVYRYGLGLSGALGLSLGAAWRIPERTALSPLGPRLIEIRDPSFTNVFPVFRTWYDENPLGSVTIQNVGKTTAANLKVSFLIKQYMDAPKLCASIPSLKPGESRELPLYALFNTSVLDVTEATKATAEVIVEYMAGEAAASQATTATIAVYDRNAMTWDDDRKAAAFVSGKDPWVLFLSNQVSNIVKPRRNAGIDRNLQLGLAFHEALRLYGISYSFSPTTPFAAIKANPQTVDFLKFPRQTLSYRAGDCADLSILYASVFESVGIESAFITIPGHILMAFALDTAPEAMSRTAASPDLIIREGKAWVPIETTLREADFMAAWAEGAKEWKLNLAAGKAAFHPIHEAWKTYRPVGLSADSTSVSVPDAGLVAKAFSAVLGGVVERELAFQVGLVNEAMRRTGQTPKALNDRGIVYARLGKYEPALADFRAAGVGNAYLPALVNLGSVFYLKRDVQGAYDAYRRAAAMAPANATIQANLARAAASLGKAEEAAKALAAVKSMDPELAAELAKAVQGGAEGIRSAEAESGPGVLWIRE